MVFSNTSQPYFKVALRRQISHLSKLPGPSLNCNCQKMINSILDSISLYPRFNSKYYSIQKNSADSIQKIIQFNSQELFDTGQIVKLPENCPKSVQNRQKGDFHQKW